MSESLDEILKDISVSLQSTKTIVDELVSGVQNEENSYPQIIQSLLDKSSQQKVEGMSLLALKNNALISYLNNLALIVLSQLERLETKDISDIEKIREDVIKRTVVQRVALEKGVKPLEKKLTYQLDKMVRSYTRMEADETELEEKLKSKYKNGQEGEDSDDSSDDEDVLSYRPDAAALAKMAPKSSRNNTKSRDGDEESNEKYKPPKISAVAPPTAPQRDPDAKEKEDKNKKLQSMEEYLREQSDLPSVESSIGSTIVDHGRGGVKTQHDKKKEQEVQRYEESNFIRLPQNQTKKSFKQRRRDMVNTFGGEDWSMFSETNSRNVSTGTSRKRKAGSAWDKVKKRRD